MKDYSTTDALAYPEDVVAVLPTLDSRVSPLPFIITAHAIVSRQLMNPGLIPAPAGGVDGDGNLLLDTGLLTQIEIWLAAHLASIADAMHASESGTGRSASRALPQMGEGLKATSHGRQVMALDYTGTLAAYFLRERPIVFAVFGTGAPNDGQFCRDGQTT